MKEHIIHPIQPFYDEDSQILILGSFPSVKSREQMFFYGHPQNRFWKVIASVFGDATPETIPEKKRFLTGHHIAMWDVIGSCDIEGSSDSSIENVVANDLSVILEKAKIRCIYVNGKTAEKYYRKYTEHKTGMKAVCLPSTSPANAAWKIDRLVDAWKEAINKSFEIENIIKELFAKKKIGQVDQPIVPVSGGYMHRMYKVNAGGKVYAVKHLNPIIMKRPDAMDNYIRAEKLESIIEKAGIPVVAVLSFDGAKMQKIRGEYFYIFPWQEGSITDWNNITPEQCSAAGSIQGRIHSIEQRKTNTPPELSNIYWDEYINEADRIKSEIAGLLRDSRKVLDHAQNELNEARKNLPDIECITDEDMDPKNVMWYEGKPYVIDLECLDYGNPVSHALQLSLQWAGATLCSIDTNKVKAFFDGYLAVYDNGFRGYDKVFGLAYTWIEWLEYNITRALGQCSDEKEHLMGIEEVKNTINRIKHIRKMEKEIKEVLI